MHRKGTICVGLFVVATVAACTQVPDLDVSTERVRVIDVVKRVKCDLFEAFTDPEDRQLLSHKAGYEWLKDWTAQVDLSLVVNNQSGLTPGVTFVEPLLPVSIPRVGNFPQSFNMGLGGGVNTTAARTETITFSLSVKEIDEEFRDPRKSWKYQNCQFDNGPGLRSELQLREWISSALAPAAPDKRYLTPGRHQAPKAKAGGSSTVAKKAGGEAKKGAAGLATAFREPLAASLVSLGEFGQQVNQLLKDIQTLMKEIRDSKQKPLDRTVIQEIKTVLKKTEDTIPLIENPKKEDEHDVLEVAKPYGSPGTKPIGLVQHLYTNAIVLDWIGQFDQLTKEKEPTFSRIEELSLLLDKDIRRVAAFKPPKEIQKEIQEALDTLKKAKGELEKAKATFDPPIDSITHQVQFILSFNANASPTWTLARFKGPGPASNGLVSGTHSNTHTLSIAMGSSPEKLSQKLNAIQIGTTIGNVLITNPVQVGR